METLEKLKQITSIEQDKSLAPLTTFKIGGPAKFFCEAGSADKIIKLVEICEQEKLSYFIYNRSNSFVSLSVTSFIKFSIPKLFK